MNQYTASSPRNAQLSQLDLVFAYILSRTIVLFWIDYLQLLDKTVTDRLGIDPIACVESVKPPNGWVSEFFYVIEDVRGRGDNLPGALSNVIPQTRLSPLSKYQIQTSFYGLNPALDTFRFRQIQF